MAFTNNVMIVRHKLLAKLVNLWKENKLTNEIDRLPIELSPRRSRPLGRCCIHKERAVYKYKLFPVVGFRYDRRNGRAHSTFGIRTPGIGT